MNFRIYVLFIMILVGMLFTKVWFAAAIFLSFIFYNLFFYLPNLNHKIDSKIDFKRQRTNFTVINKVFKSDNILNAFLKKASMSADRCTPSCYCDHIDISTSPRYSDMPSNIYYQQSRR